MSLERPLQLQILQQLAMAYPRPVHDLFDLLPDCDDDEIYLINLHYLREHELINTNMHPGVAAVHWRPSITARGMDFLADDGGLSAILGTVTVKLHEDTLRQLITKKVEQADLPEPEKKRLLDQIHDLQPEAIKHLTMKLLDQGLESSGKVVGLIAGMLS